MIYHWPIRGSQFDLIVLLGTRRFYYISIPFRSINCIVFPLPHIHNSVHLIFQINCAQNCVLDVAMGIYAVASVVSIDIDRYIHTLSIQHILVKIPNSLHTYS